MVLLLSRYFLHAFLSMCMYVLNKTVFTHRYTYILLMFVMGGSYCEAKMNNFQEQQG